MQAEGVLVTQNIIDIYMQGKMYHVIFSMLLFVPYFWNLYVLSTYKTYLRINQKMFFIMPLTFFLLSTSFLPGIFILAMGGFIFSFKVSLMLICFLIFLIGEITRMIKLKKSRISEEGMRVYVKNCKIMYIIFLALYLGIIAISYL